MSSFDLYEDYLKQCPKERWIALQNFQGIRAYTKIPLAPITLLYGQNSAGKSSIHDAFHFINGFFSGEWDHKTTTAYLDRWANNKRTSNPIEKGFIGKPDDVVIGCSGFYNVEKFYEYCFFKNVLLDSPDVKVLNWLYGDEGHNPASFRVHFSYGQKGWYLREFVLYLGADVFLSYIFYGDNPDNHLFGEIIPSFSNDELNAERGSRDLCLHNSCLAFNRKHEGYYLLNTQQQIEFEDSFEHSLFVGHLIINDEWLILNRLGLLCVDGGSSDVSTPALTWKQLIYWKDYEELEGVPETLYNGRQLRSEIENIISFPVYSIITDSVLGSIPPIRDIPTKEKSIYRLKQEKNITETFHKLAYMILSSVLDKIYVQTKNQNELKDPAHILLSNLIDHIKTLNPPLENNSNENPLVQVNRLLTSTLFLDTGYEIVGDCKFIMPEDVIYSLADSSKEELRAILEQLEAEVHLRLRYIPDDLLLEIEDVGVGISQVIPVLLAANSSRVYIQQPELHLHPRLQAQLADVFVEQVSRAPIFVIETHSEHFLLRILRRIRETYRSDIAHTLFSLKAEDVVVLYVDKTKEGTSSIVQLRISAEGEFIDRWPNGFFTERDGELFDE